MDIPRARTSRWNRVWYCQETLKQAQIATTLLENGFSEIIPKRDLLNSIVVPVQEMDSIIAAELPSGFGERNLMDLGFIHS